MTDSIRSFVLDRASVYDDASSSYNTMDRRLSELESMISKLGNDVTRLEMMFLNIADIVGKEITKRDEDMVSALDEVFDGQ